MDAAATQWTTGWCGTKPPRKYPPRPAIVCYDEPQLCKVDKTKLHQLRHHCLRGNISQDFIVPKRSAKTWTMQEGELCRITVKGGSQVGDLNLWNLNNKKERFYSGKTRQLHASHLTTYDRLWSTLPHLRPMATIVADSLSGYGIDEDGASCHDVIGTRCDQYTQRLITNTDVPYSCHRALTEAVKEHGLDEQDVHDVWNIFMCTGFSKDTHKYFCKASPAVDGDYIEFIADMPLLLALSACPQGDVSTPVGLPVPDEKCHTLQVQVFSPLETA